MTKLAQEFFFNIVIVHSWQVKQYIQIMSMKTLFVCLAVLASCNGSPLQATTGASTTNSPVDNIQTQWTNAIVKWLEDVVNIPITVPKLNWRTLAEDVINYGRTFLTEKAQIYFVMKDDREALLDKPMQEVKVKKLENMNLLITDGLNSAYRSKFKGNLSNAIGRTMREWSDEYVQKLQQKQTAIETFVKSLEGVQAQLVSANDAAIKNESTMKAVQDFLAHQVAIKDASSYANTYMVKSRFLDKFRMNNNLIERLPITVNYQNIQNLSYPSIEDNNEPNLCTYEDKINCDTRDLLKNNIAQLTLFIKETMNYDDLSFGKDKMSVIKDAGTKILAFTPEIIQYFKRVSEALAVVIKNFAINKKLVTDNITKIKAATGL